MLRVVDQSLLPPDTVLLVSMWLYGIHWLRLQPLALPLCVMKVFCSRRTSNSSNFVRCNFRVQNRKKGCTIAPLQTELKEERILQS